MWKLYVIVISWKQNVFYPTKWFCMGCLISRSCSACPECGEADGLSSRKQLNQPQKNDNKDQWKFQVFFNSRSPFSDRELKPLYPSIHSSNLLPPTKHFFLALALDLLLYCLFVCLSHHMTLVFQDEQINSGSAQARNLFYISYILWGDETVPMFRKCLCIISL